MGNKHSTAIGQSSVGAKGETFVLWFPDPNLPCNDHFSGKGCRFGPRCKFSHSPTSYSRLLEQLNHARSTLDICVFNITADQIARAVIDAHKRGVQVRIITDNDQARQQGSDVQQLRQAGVPVRMDKTPAHMHNKFCIIDSHTVMNGSFNWTISAVKENNENVVVSRDPALAAEFTRHFNKLWADFA